MVNAPRPIDIPTHAFGTSLQDSTHTQYLVLLFYSYSGFYKHAWLILTPVYYLQVTQKVIS